MQFGEFFREWRDESLKSLSKLQQPAVESEAFVQAMDAGSSALLEAQKHAREAQLKALDAANLPTRKDLAALSHQVQLAEKRSLECEDRAEAVTACTRTLEERLNGVVAALEASQARVTQLQARIEQALAAAVVVEKPIAAAPKKSTAKAAVTAPKKTETKKKSGPAPKKKPKSK